MNSPTKKQKVDPSVECLIKLFPEDFIRAIAAETGFIIRNRKIDPVIFFWVIVLGFGVNFLRTIRGLKRKYENESNIEITISSFNDRFTQRLENFLKKCVIHALEYQAQEPGLKLGDKLKNFKDLLIQDSTIIRLHESLANLWPVSIAVKNSPNSAG